MKVDTANVEPNDDAAVSLATEMLANKYTRVNTCRVCTRDVALLEAGPTQGRQGKHCIDLRAIVREVCQLVFEQLGGGRILRQANAHAR